MLAAKTLLLISVYVAGGFCAESFHCPPKEVTFPCQCDDTRGRIICKNTGSANLAETMRKMDNALTGKPKFFRGFYLDNTGLSDLAANFTAGFIFDSIAIEKNKNLTHIHPKAFSGPTATKTRFLMVNDNNLSNPNSTLEAHTFAAITSFKNLEHFSARGNHFTVIPERAFQPSSGGNLMKLENVYLVLNKAPITSVGDLAFYNLDNLRLLSLADQPLKKISKYAFAFPKDLRKNAGLLLVLSRCDLTAETFANGSLTYFKRPTTLRLGHFDGPGGPYCNPALKLERNLFKPFLDIHSRNIIHMGACPMTCDCSVSWLYADKERAQKRVLGTKCEDNNKSLWEQSGDKFKNCKN